jgi:hypothetical protein
MYYKNKLNILEVPHLYFCTQSWIAHSLADLETLPRIDHLWQKKGTSFAIATGLKPHHPHLRKYSNFKGSTTHQGLGLAGRPYSWDFGFHHFGVITIISQVSPLALVVITSIGGS